MQQLSHSDEYQDPDNPSQAIFEPELMRGELKGKFVVDAACGEEHTMVVCHIRNGEGKTTHELVYACGNNLKGQLGINRISHLNDFTLVEDLSELYDGQDSE
jgi:alpha-tubulin suppressor-like RCC1 family protein